MAKFRLFNDDCLVVMPRLEENSVDLVLVDPPYGTTSCKWDSVIDLKTMWGQLRGVISSKAVIAITASQPFTSILVTSNLPWFRHEWIWIKNRGSNFANTVREPMKEHESVVIFSPGKWTYNRQMQERTGTGVERVKGNFNFRSKSENYRDFEGRENQKLPEMRVPSSWQKFNTACGKEKMNHPTQKPVALMEYLIKTYSNKGDTVLDFAMGSGTTGVACGNLNRNFIGIDNDKEHGYFKIAYKRVREAYRG